MNTAILNQLKTGSVKKVILFGDSGPVPVPPYVVLKPEPTEENDRQNFRISIHRNPGENDISEAYIFTELPALLSNRIWMETGSGSKFRLMNSGEWNGPLAPEDSETIVYERIFFAPKLI
ncbi:MAG: hypothetical protein FWG89_04270 [Treponema sp.]|nr:hypothetical protein [Treponema sp.]